MILLYCYFIAVNQADEPQLFLLLNGNIAHCRVFIRTNDSAFKKELYYFCFLISRYLAYYLLLLFVFTVYKLYSNPANLLTQDS